eukprot:CAMPEP_0179140978 /NCGR_PEP_ID=MMETSP0796-20121207/67566_1 /TAXON_ID=73915 /ORGANISM="Pyrodinium bahamense, Strain pbaha01" /LENGTH=59 /DNA_ID=CAMNT_0020840621 /DNA_START=18 /DNA_END=193 /DNA_ORIENTATION=+
MHLCKVAPEFPDAYKMPQLGATKSLRSGRTQTLPSNGSGCLMITSGPLVTFESVRRSLP